MEGTGIPKEWSNELDGFGASDHFPLVARFSSGRFSKSENGRSFEIVENSLRRVDFSKALEEAVKWKPDSLDPRNYGRIYLFSGAISQSNPITLTAQGHRMGLYSFDPETRKVIFGFKKGESIGGYGRLRRAIAANGNSLSRTELVKAILIAFGLSSLLSRAATDFLCISR